MCGILVWFSKENSTLSLENQLKKIKHRGPDSTDIVRRVGAFGEITFGFNRLSIINPGAGGDQPIDIGGVVLACNGEIYNYRELATLVDLNPENFKSDCEIIIHLYLKFGIDYCVKNLDGVFSFVLWDSNNNRLYAARDPIGVRPMFHSHHKSGIAFCSEIKGLSGTFDNVLAFPPSFIGVYHTEESCDPSVWKLRRYADITDAGSFLSFGGDREFITNRIRDLLTNAVKKRLMSDRPICYMLSGGLDSSLIAAIASRIVSPERVQCFSIGSHDCPDIKKAKIVADYLGAQHTIVDFNFKDGIDVLRDTIYHLESYDCTTIRASVPMYLLSQYISKNTNYRVVLSGEGADEIFGGYLYFSYAPNAQSFQWETKLLTEQLYWFDVLRADRTTSAHGLEVRVPFLDKKFLQHVFEIDSRLKEIKIPGTGVAQHGMSMEKQILRESFEGYLPKSILYRQKNAFSDSVGYGWVDALKDYAASVVTDEEFLKQNNFSTNKPLTKEEYLYRKIYHEFYPQKGELPRMWRPKWTSVTDPSATYLSVQEDCRTKIN